MRRAIANMNPFVRGLAIVALVALVIVVLQLQTTLTALFLIARIAFFIAMAVFVYLLWHERRSEIGEWDTRARSTFYGAALLLLVDIGWFVLGGGRAGLDALAFFLALGAGGFAMWRVWRDEHTYG